MQSLYTEDTLISFSTEIIFFHDLDVHRWSSPAKYRKSSCWTKNRKIRLKIWDCNWGHYSRISVVGNMQILYFFFGKNCGPNMVLNSEESQQELYNSCSKSQLPFHWGSLQAPGSCLWYNSAVDYLHVQQTSSPGAKWCMEQHPER